MPSGPRATLASRPTCDRAQWAELICTALSGSGTVPPACRLPPPGLTVFNGQLRSEAERRPAARWHRGLTSAVLVPGLPLPSHSRGEDRDHRSPDGRQRLVLFTTRGPSPGTLPAPCPCPAQTPPPNPTAADPGDGRVQSRSALRVHEPCNFAGGGCPAVTAGLGGFRESRILLRRVRGRTPAFPPACWLPAHYSIARTGPATMLPGGRLAPRRPVHPIRARAPVWAVDR